MTRTIWFVTPVWGRFALTAVCLEQRRRVIEELAGHGVEAHCVVIGDDANLDTAESLGFATVERSNDWLDTKFSDGMQYAGEHGAEWIVPIGSDSWIDPAYFLPLPGPRETRTSGLYAVVEMQRLAQVKVGRLRGSVQRRPGAGPYMFSRAQLEPRGWRVAGDGERQRGIDGATITNIGGVIPWRDRDIHELQYVGFRGSPHITRFEKLLRWDSSVRRNGWSRLAQRYDADLVTAAHDAMKADAAAWARDHADEVLTQAAS